MSTRTPLRIEDVRYCVNRYDHNGNQTEEGFVAGVFGHREWLPMRSGERAGQYEVFVFGEWVSAVIDC